MTIAARPMTMAPVPMPMSAYFWLWQMRPPERPMSALERMRASILVAFVFWPRARIMASLLPVARSALPISVPKNQYSSQITAATRMAPTIMATVLWGMPVKSDTFEKIVSAVSSGVFDLPMMRRLIDHRLICVRIPARMAGISNTVVRTPVTAPATPPASMPARVATTGSTPKLTTRTATTAPPRAKLPSQVMSGMASRRKVMKTPSTMRPHRIPCETAPCSAVSMCAPSCCRCLRRWREGRFLLATGRCYLGGPTSRRAPRGRRR